MSGRNNRIVRNRERSNKEFQINGTIIKIIAGVIAIILVIVLIVVFVNSRKEKKSTTFNNNNGSVNYNYFVLTSGENVGVVNKEGNIVVETKYNEIDIPNPEKPVFICYTDEGIKILGENEKQIFSEYEEIEAIKSTATEVNQIEPLVLKYKFNGQYGLIDLEKNVITEAIYDEISSLDYRPGSILVKKDNKYGLIDSKGNTIISLEYDSITADGYCLQDKLYEKTGYIVSKKADDGVNYGYIDYTGEMLLDVKYEYIERALEYDKQEPYLIVMQKGKKGVFKGEKKLIDLSYQDIKYSELSKVFIVNKNGKYGFYNLSGKVILNPEYEKYSIAGNYISVEKDDEKSLFDINGNLINMKSYTKMIETENPSYFIAEDDAGYYSIISKDVNIEGQYEQVSYAFDNYFIFTDESGKFGVINAIIDFVEIEPEYDFIIFVEGTRYLQAIDGMNNLVEIYSSELEKTVTMEDGIVETLDNGYSRIYSETELVYINSEGEIVENTEVYSDKELYSVTQNEKWGYKNKSGDIVIEPIYDIVTEFNQYGFAGIKQNGKWGVINNQGEIIAEPTYELDTYYFPEFIGKYVFIKAEMTYCKEIQ